MKKLILILIILTGFLSCQSNKSQEVGANKSQEVGDFYQGGVVFYIFGPGDTGYVAGETHGLIAAIADQSSGGIPWYDDGTLGTSGRIETGATGTAVGTGSANTDAIINVYGATKSPAAGLARAYTGGGYTDWFLPSKDELNQMFINQRTLDAVYIDFSPFSSYYWSSTETKKSHAWEQGFRNGKQYTIVKSRTRSVRAVRAF